MTSSIHDGLHRHATHQAVLLKELLSRRHEDTLEFGGGWYSTALFDAFARKRKGKHFCIERDPTWLARLEQFFPSTTFLPSLPQDPGVRGDYARPTLVMVDSDPEPVRIQDMEAAKLWVAPTGRIIIHDFNRMQLRNYAMKQMLPYRLLYVDTNHPNHTALFGAPGDHLN